MLDRTNLLLPFFLFGCLSTACGPGPANQDKTTETTENMQTTITRTDFGALPDGTAVDLFTLTNKNGITVKITNYGGIVTSLAVPDRTGNMGDIVLGFDSLPPYLAGHPYFGAIVGRFGNRIANAKFTLDGKDYQLAANNGPNHLHGGLVGFDKKLWRAETSLKAGAVVLSLFLNSPDGEEGYPGNLDVQVDYTLADNDELRIDYTALTDKKTVANLTHHSYFNLTGNPSNGILGHELQIFADAYLPVNETLIPSTGPEVLNGDPFDFRQAKPIGRDITANHVQLKIAGGYDHCWVLKKTSDGPTLQLAATAHDPLSGRLLEVWTTEPGIQFYSGNFLDGSLTGKGNTTYNHRAGFCLETEHFPDSPNQPDFPNVVLAPGEVLRSATVYRFSIKK